MLDVKSVKQAKPATKEYATPKMCLGNDTFFSVFSQAKTGASVVDIRKWILDNDGTPRVPMSSRFSRTSGVCLDPEAFKKIVGSPEIAAAMSEKRGYAAQFGDGVGVALSPCSDGTGMTMSIDSKGNAVRLTEAQWASLKTCVV